MKLLGNTKINITKHENGKNMPYLEISEVVLVLVILPAMIINKIKEFPISS